MSENGNALGQKLSKMTGIEPMARQSNRDRRE